MMDRPPERVSERLEKGFVCRLGDQPQHHDVAPVLDERLEAGQPCGCRSRVVIVVDDALARLPSAGALIDGEAVAVR